MTKLSEYEIKNAKDIHVYTDGACSPNPGIGGWGAVFVNEVNGKTIEISGAVEKSTNNIMELTAVVNALEFLLRRTGPQFVRVYSDSKYLLNGITGWIHNWKKNCWVASNGDPVKNRDLWMRLDELRTEHKIVVFEYVPAHNGYKYNEIADDLAVAARRRLKEEIGHTQPL